MPALENVSSLALALPGTTEGLGRAGKPWLSWYVDGRCFAWERTFSKADVRRFGDARIPGDPILAVATAGLEDDARLRALMAGAHQHLYDHGGEESFWEEGWLRTERDRWSAPPSGG